jgi:hypothetical protein
VTSGDFPACVCRSWAIIQSLLERTAEPAQAEPNTSWQGVPSSGGHHMFISSHNQKASAFGTNIPFIPIHISFDFPIHFLFPLLIPVSSQFPSTFLTSRHGHSTSYIYANTLTVYFPQSDYQLHLALISFYPPECSNVSPASEIRHRVLRRCNT